MLKAALPRAEGVILPTVGHQPHLTHAEVTGRLDRRLAAPLCSGGCTEEHRSKPMAAAEEPLTDLLDCASARGEYNAGLQTALVVQGTSVALNRGPGHWDGNVERCPIEAGDPGDRR